MRRALAAATAAAVLVTACTADDGDGDEPGAAPSPSTTAAPEGTSPPPPTSDEPTAGDDTDDADDGADTGADVGAGGDASVDPTSTPDEITRAWAEAAVNTLLSEYGAVLADAMRRPPVDGAAALPDDLVERVDALFDDEYEERRLDELEVFATDENDARSFVLPPDEFEGLRVEGVTVQYGQPSCVILVARVDRAGVLPDGGLAPELSAWSLSPKDTDVGINPTDWVVVDQLPNRGSAGPNTDEFMLDSTLETYGDALVHSCVSDVSG